jgi:cytochrome d ubiquinol oxidase subunit I
MDMDAILLARIQFAFTVTFHIIFPSFSIGLAAFIATLLVRWRMTGEERFRRLARFWTKIFAVSFAMGVVSGIVLSYQFGTNWARFSVVAGNIIGPLMGYEVLMAFFLEATFLGIMLFGWERVSPNLHVLAAILVAAGTSLSAFWILAANSWMQTPAGYEMKDGIAYPVSWLHIIFNPSFPYRIPDHIAGRRSCRCALSRCQSLCRRIEDDAPHGARNGRCSRAVAAFDRRRARAEYR